MSFVTIVRKMLSHLLTCASNFSACLSLKVSFELDFHSDFVHKVMHRNQNT